jgi:hypothetical protein
MFKDMICHQSREESEEKENCCSNTFTNKWIDVKVAVSEELIYKVTEVEKDVHKISCHLGESSDYFLILCSFIFL